MNIEASMHVVLGVFLLLFSEENFKDISNEQSLWSYIKSPTFSREAKPLTLKRRILLKTCSFLIIEDLFYSPNE